MYKNLKLDEVTKNVMKIGGQAELGKYEKVVEELEELEQKLREQKARETQEKEEKPKFEIKKYPNL